MPLSRNRSRSSSSAVGRFRSLRTAATLIADQCRSTNSPGASPRYSPGDVASITGQFWSSSSNPSRSTSVARTSPNCAGGTSTSKSTHQNEFWPQVHALAQCRALENNPWAVESPESVGQVIDDRRIAHPGSVGTSRAARSAPTKPGCCGGPRREPGFDAVHPRHVQNVIDGRRTQLSK